MAHTDFHVGRLIDSLEKSGELDNTLVMYIVGDNGPSAEGGLRGDVQRGRQPDRRSIPGWPASSSGSTRSAGRESSRTSPSAGPGRWTPRSSGPSKWPATSAAPATRWSSTGPRASRPRARLRTQYHHVIDVVPTILEACKIPEPKVVNGIPQKPIEGVSMLYSFDDAKAKSKRTTQYFEMFVNRAIYHDGWLACSRFGVPWTTAGKEGDFLKAPWELYNLDADFSQADDLAAQEPGQAEGTPGRCSWRRRRSTTCSRSTRGWPSGSTRGTASPATPRTSWTYFGNNVRLPEPIGPIIFPNSHTITAELMVPEKGCEGVIDLRRRHLRRVVLLRQGRQAGLPLQLRRLRLLQRGRQGSSAARQGDAQA